QDRKEQHGQRRLQDRPRDAEKGLPVSQLQIPDCQRPGKDPVAPELSDVQPAPPASPRTYDSPLGELLYSPRGVAAREHPSHRDVDRTFRTARLARTARIRWNS